VEALKSPKSQAQDTMLPPLTEDVSVNWIEFPGHWGEVEVKFADTKPAVTDAPLLP